MNRSTEALAFISSMADDYEFPILDNPNWEFIAGRLLGYRIGQSWALVFELLIFQLPAEAFWIQVYGFGPLLGGRDGNVGVRSAIEECEATPLWDERSDWIIEHRYFDVLVRGERVRVDTRGHAPGSLQLSNGDMSSEGDFARALVRELGLTRLLPVEAVFELLPDLADVPEVIRLANWDHPDFTRGQAPKDSQALIASLRVLCDGDEEFTYDHSADNVADRRWRAPSE